MRYTGKKTFLALILVSYGALALLFQGLLAADVLTKMSMDQEAEAPERAPEFFDSDVLFRLEASQQFLEEWMVRPNGHVELYHAVSGTGDTVRQTNSEAISYYLLWTAQAERKADFDRSLNFMEENMLHPDIGYMMWRLEENGSVQGDGSNIASDADLRAIKALLLAEERWGDARYTEIIDTLSEGLERTAVTEDEFLAPYGGASGEDSTWVADEVWLSYVDFTVLRALEERRGEPWGEIYDNMKEAVLGAQIHNGLYNPQLTADREYGNGLDAGAYSINSLWVMVRNAESGDEELMDSAREGLAFYKSKYREEGTLHQGYDSSGNVAVRGESPWAYALVGRAAINLGDLEFAEKMVDELLTFQNVLEERWYGAILEGEGKERRASQFTIQESILTLQDYKQSSLSSGTSRSQR